MVWKGGPRMSIGKVQEGYGRYAGAVSAAKQAQAGQDAATATVEVTKEENRDVVDFSSQLEESQKKQEALRQMMEQLAQSKNSFKISSTPPQDSSARLTRRLVGATMEMEVRNVMVEAGQALTKLQIASATCEKGDKAKIEAMIRRIKKVLDRGGQKIKDLGNEQVLQARQKNAKAARQEARAEKLKDELRRRQAKRRDKEQGYLREADQQTLSDATQQAVAQSGGRVKLDAASEAQIEAEAQAMAAAEVAAGGGDVAVGGDIAVSGGEVAAGGAAAAEGGGAEGGEVAAAE